MFIDYIMLIYFLVVPVSILLSIKFLPGNGNLFLDILIIAGNIEYLYFGNVSDLSRALMIMLLYLPVMILLTAHPGLARKLVCFNRQKPEFSLNRQLGILLATLREELVWRLAFVAVLRRISICEYAIIFAGTALFYISHMNLSRRLILPAQIDLLLFSSLLYLLYSKTDSILSVWLVHYLRNAFVTCFRNNRC